MSEFFKYTVSREAPTSVDKENPYLTISNPLPEKITVTDSSTTETIEDDKTAISSTAPGANSTEVTETVQLTETPNTPEVIEPETQPIKIQTNKFLLITLIVIAGVLIGTKILK